MATPIKYNVTKTMRLPGNGKVAANAISSQIGFSSIVRGKRILNLNSFEQVHIPNWT